MASNTSPSWAGLAPKDVEDLEVAGVEAPLESPDEEPQRVQRPLSRQLPQLKAEQLFFRGRT
jgi:hypothetical protein